MVPAAAVVSFTVCRSDLRLLYRLFIGLPTYRGSVRISAALRSECARYTGWTRHIRLQDEALARSNHHPLYKGLLQSRTFLPVLWGMLRQREPARQVMKKMMRHRQTLTKL